MVATRKKNFLTQYFKYSQIGEKWIKKKITKYFSFSIIFSKKIINFTSLIVVIFEN